MSKNSLCLTLLTSIFIFSSVSVAEDWELRKDKESILVYTRNVDESKFQEFKGITKIKTSLNSLVTLLEDTNTCKNWVYKCLSEETIKTVSLNEKFIYFVSDASPLKNRDAIIHVTRTQDPKTKKEIDISDALSMDDVGEEEVFVVVEDMPRFPGCEDTRDKNERDKNGPGEPRSRYAAFWLQVAHDSK